MRNPSIGSAAYAPGLPPDSPSDLRRYTQDELERIAAAIGRVAEGHVDEAHVAPPKPRDGDVRFADGTNWNPGKGRGLYAYFGGTWNILTDGITWNDIRTGGLSLRSQGVSDPTLAIFTNGVYTLQFPAGSMRQAFFSIQLPHTYKEGTDIYPHVHWSPMTTNTGNVTWGLEYTWANRDGTFPATTTITTTQAGDGIALKHQIAPFAAISGTGKKLSSLLIGRLYRAGNTDTFTGAASLLEIDFHHQIDATGSSSEFVK